MRRPDRHVKTNGNPGGRGTGAYLRASSAGQPGTGARNRGACLPATALHPRDDGGDENGRPFPPPSTGKLTPLKLRRICSFSSGFHSTVLFVCAVLCIQTTFASTGTYTNQYYSDKAGLPGKNA